MNGGERRKTRFIYAFLKAAPDPDPAAGRFLFLFCTKEFAAL